VLIGVGVFPRKKRAGNPLGLELMHRGGFSFLFAGRFRLFLGYSTNSCIMVLWIMDFSVDVFFLFLGPYFLDRLMTIALLIKRVTYSFVVCFVRLDSFSLL